MAVAVGVELMVGVAFETVFPDDDVATLALLDAPPPERTTAVALLYVPAASAEENLTYTVAPLATDTDELKVVLSVETS
jgi:thioesterase domain-containing protein